MIASVGAHYVVGSDVWQQKATSDIAAYSGSFLDSLSANFGTWKTGFLVSLLFIALFYAPMMMVGLGLYKLEFFSGRLRPSVYATFVGAGAVALLCVAAAYAAEIASGYAGVTILMADYFRQLLTPIIALAYAAGLALMLLSRRCSFIPRLLAPVGQMAFTNYLTQSIIMTGIFYGGRGPGLFGRLNLPVITAIVVAVWILQIWWSNLWLRHFAMGPFEWVWRRLYRGPEKYGLRGTPVAA